MIVFFVLYVVLCFIGCRLPKKGERFISDYMSVEKTMSIKGIFIIMVFFQHFNSYVKYVSPWDKLYSESFNEIGQCMVTLFLLYSGYGVMESIKKKGLHYIHRIPLQRFLGTYFRFDIAIVIFALVQLAIGKTYPVKQYLLSLTAWDAIGNSNWYIFAVGFLYLLTFVIFEIAGRKGRYYIPAAIFTAVLIAVVFVCYQTKVRPVYWYDTVICYAWGMWYSLLREKIEKIVTKNLIIYHIVLAVSMLATYYFMNNRNKNLYTLLLCMSFFAVTVVLVSMRISLHNKVLMWCGKNLFGLYILQRIPMIVLAHLGLTKPNVYMYLLLKLPDFNTYVYFILSAVITVLTAWLFEKYVGRLWKFIITPRKKTA